MNPFDQLGYQELEGCEGLNGLDGFSFKRLKKKLKKTIRKVGKVVAPIVVGVVAGPAAGAAVAKQIYEGIKTKKAAKKEAKSLGVSWTNYKKLASGEAKQTDQTLIKLTGNKQAPKIANLAVQNVREMQQLPQYRQINQQLASQGYSEQQRQQMFVRSAPVQDVIKTSTAAAIYGGVRQQGYSSGQAASTAANAVKNSENQQAMGNLLPLLIPAALLLT